MGDVVQIDQARRALRASARVNQTVAEAMFALSPSVALGLMLIWAGVHGWAEAMLRAVSVKRPDC